jgi:hypothetical protein
MTDVPSGDAPPAMDTGYFHQVCNGRDGIQPRGARVIRSAGGAPRFIDPRRDAGMGMATADEVAKFIAEA